MPKTFTYNGDLSTALDYARARMDDIDPNAALDEFGNPAPFLYDEVYLALFEKHGVQYGMHLAAKMIAVRISKLLSSFGEAAGVRISWKDRLAGIKNVADEILQEPPYDAANVAQTLASSGVIKRGQDDSYWPYRRIEVYPRPLK